MLRTTVQDRDVAGGFVKDLTMPERQYYMHLHVIQIKTRIRVFMRYICDKKYFLKFYF